VKEKTVSAAIATKEGVVKAYHLATDPETQKTVKENYQAGMAMVKTAGEIQDKAKEYGIEVQPKDIMEFVKTTNEVQKKQ
jgi:hypothetical protein